MRRYILMICLVFSIQGMAQIAVGVEYSSKTKVVTLSLNNKTDSYFNFIPIDYGNYYKYLNSISFTFKDSKGHVLGHAERFIYDEQFHQPRGKGRYLFPHETNRYIHKLRRWYDGDDVYKVEVLVKIDARIVDPNRKGGGKSTKQETYKTEFRKTVLW
ncbi:hypothetical protein [Hallella bergensis]|nr:hypothetical protein [Hallella bergensis]